MVSPEKSLNLHKLIIKCLPEFLSQHRRFSPQPKISKSQYNYKDFFKVVIFVPNDGSFEFFGTTIFDGGPKKKSFWFLYKIVLSKTDDKSFSQNRSPICG